MDFAPNTDDDRRRLFRCCRWAVVPALLLWAAFFWLAFAVLMPLGQHLLDL